MRSMLKASWIFVLSVPLFAQPNQINPRTQIKWPDIALPGTPTAEGLTCSSIQYGMPYTNTAVTPNTFYTCGSDGWVIRGAVGGTGTTGYLAKWTSSTAIGASTADYGITNAGAFTFPGNVYALAFNGTNTTDGPSYVMLPYNPGTLPGLVASAGGFAGPPSTGGTPYLIFLPPSVTAAGIPHFAAPTTIAGVNGIQMTSSLVGISDLSATGSPGSGNFLRGDNTWSPAGGGCTTNCVVTNPTTTQTIVNTTSAVVPLRIQQATFAGGAPDAFDIGDVNAVNDLLRFASTGVLTICQGSGGLCQTFSPGSGTFVDQGSLSIQAANGALNESSNGQGITIQNSNTDGDDILLEAGTGSGDNTDLVTLSGAFNTNSVGSIYDVVSVYAGGNTEANDCTIACTNPFGIATASPGGGTTNVTYIGRTIVNLDTLQTVTPGDIVCTSTTMAGRAHDNGTTPCSTAQIGYVNVSGTSVGQAHVLLSIRTGLGYRSDCLIPTQSYPCVVAQNAPALYTGFSTFGALNYSVGSSAAGLYRMCIYAAVVTAYSAGGFAPTLTYTEDGTSFSRLYANSSVNAGVSAGTATGDTLSTGSASTVQPFSQGCKTFYADASSTIGFSNTNSSLTSPAGSIRHAEILERLE